MAPLGDRALELGCRTGHGKEDVFGTDRPSSEDGAVEHEMRCESKE